MLVEIAGNEKYFWRYGYRTKEQLHAKSVLQESVTLYRISTDLETVVSTIFKSMTRKFSRRRYVDSCRMGASFDEHSPGMRLHSIHLCLQVWRLILTRTIFIVISHATDIAVPIVPTMYFFLIY